jgi:cell division protease FtsH
MTEDEKKTTAYHEAGHAIVALHVEGNNPLHKVTIIPRGRALGVTWTMPERDMLNRNQKQMKADLAMSYGGRIAEQLIYGMEELNTGAASDLQHATRLARAMVMEYGMSKKLGWLHYRDGEETYLGQGGGRSHISEETSQMIDSEVRRLLEEAEAVARKVLSDNLDQLHRLAEALLEYETLSGEETKRVIVGEDIGRDDPTGVHTPVAAGGTSIPKIRRPKGPFGNPAPQGA